MFINPRTVYLYNMLLKKNILFSIIHNPPVKSDINLLYLLFYQVKKAIIFDSSRSSVVYRSGKNFPGSRRINTYTAVPFNHQNSGSLAVKNYTLMYENYFLTEKSHNIYKFEFMANFFKFKNKNFFIYSRALIKKNIKNIFLLILNLGYGGRSFHFAPCFQLTGEINFFNTYALKKKSRQHLKKNKPLPGIADIVVILDLHENFGKISFYKSLQTPIIAITDHYTNPNVVEYPIIVDKLDFFTKYFVFSTLSNLFLTGKSLKNKYYQNNYIRLKNLSFLNQSTVSSVLNVSIYNWVNSFFLLNSPSSQKYIFWLVDQVRPGKLKKNYKKPVIQINFMKTILLLTQHGYSSKFKGHTYLLDLFVRFSPYSMQLIRYRFAGKSWLNLPCFANIAAVPKFRNYRGGVLTVGNRDYLPINATYSGIALPFLIRFNKTPLWLPNWYSFTLVNYHFGGTSQKKHFKALNASNLILNNLPSLGQFAISRARRIPRIRGNLLKYSGVLKKLYNLNAKTPNSSSRSGGVSINSFSEFLRGQDYKSRRGYNILSRRSKPKNINIKVRQRVHLKWYRSNYNFLFYKRFRNKKLNKIFNKSFGGSFVKQKISAELNIVNILLRAHFIYFYTDAVRCVQMHLVTVNGSVVHDPSYSCFEFDRVGFVLSKSYFSYFRSAFSSSISKEYRSSFYHYTSANLRAKRFKTPKSRNPKWPRKMIWERVDIPKYLEVDFLTMTAVVVYNPRYPADFFSYFNKYNNLPTRRMFNWKYLY